MLVLGLDPGFSSCGYAVLLHDGRQLGVVSMGVLRTKKSSKKLKVLAADDNVRRCRELARALRGLLDGGPLEPKLGAGLDALFGDKVKIVCAEKMSFPRSSSVAAKMAMTWGALTALCEVRNLPLLQASPQEVKKRVTGAADASKEQVERAMRRRFPAAQKLVRKLPKGQHEHAWDALASAVACLDSDEVRMMLAVG